LTFSEKGIDFSENLCIIPIIECCLKSTKKLKESEALPMTNTDLLEQKIRESGKKKKHLAEKCGLTRAGFRNCLTNKAEFKASQIDVLCEELNITSLKEKESIFFAKCVA
jgi:hypothetical protein